MKLLIAILLVWTCTCSNGQTCRQVRNGAGTLFTCPAASPLPPLSYLPLPLR